MGAGIVFLLIGMAVIAISIQVKGRRRRHFRSWPVAAGVVTGQEDAPGTLSTTETRLQVMHYSYSVSGATYSDKLQIIIGKTMGENVRRQAFLDSYPVGKSLDVHYDPADPSKSLIEPESEGGTFLTLIGAALALIGVVAILTHR
ncbi:MAG: DUF3592 domain-containing protein [Candidatus Dormibacterales bacterium]